MNDSNFRGRLNRNLLLIGLFFSFLPGCADKEHGTRRLIRLADPERIETVNSEYLELLTGERVEYPESGPFATLDSESEWYAFPLHYVRKKDLPAKKLISSDISRLRKDGGLLLQPGIGIAQFVPVRPDSRIWIECNGRFGRTGGFNATVIQLPIHPKRPKNYMGNILFDDPDDSIFIKAQLNPQDSNDSAMGLVKTLRSTKSLLVLVSSKGKSPGTFDRLKMSYLGDEKSSFLSIRAEEGIVHPGLAMQPYIEATTRPSFLLPPKTSITLKEMTVPEGAELRCHLGVNEKFTVPITLALTARDGKGEVYEIYRESLAPPLKGWIEIEKDLSRIEGQRVKFTFSCDWADVDHERPFNPPLACCGSPIIFYKDAHRGQRIHNVILISLDTLRADRLGCYGYDRPVSPCIDDFARKNFLFENAYANASYTLASHASLFSSLYPSVHGLQAEKDRFADKVELLAEVLARQGFATASFNNGGMVSHEFDFHRGFDLYCEVDPIGHRTLDGKSSNKKVLADGSTGSLERTLSWIESAENTRFFLFLHTFMIHDYQPPRKLAEKFCTSSAGKIKSRREVNGILRWENFKENGVSQEDLEYLQNAYDATIRAADEMVGEILEHLDSLELLDNTLIVITSDHGEEFMEHGYLQHAKSVYEEVIRVPLIMNAPGMESGCRVDGSVSLVDVMPTVLELLEVECPDMIQGRSLVPLLRGRTGSDRLIIAEVDLPKRSHRRCFIRKGWKYLEGDPDEKLIFSAPAAHELYRLIDDPGEEQDLSSRHPEKMDDFGVLFRKLWDGFRQTHDLLDSGNKSDSEISEELQKILRQQGYL